MMSQRVEMTWIRTGGYGANGLNIKLTLDMCVKIFVSNYLPGVLSGTSVMAKYGRISV